MVVLVPCYLPIRMCTFKFMSMVPFQIIFFDVVYATDTNMLIC